MASEPHCILLIEDDPDYSSMLLKLLRREGFTALHAATGSAGLILAESRQPDLVLLDIKLPNTDGVKLFAALRRNPKTSAIPVILITGLELPPGVLTAISSNLRTEQPFCKSEGVCTLLSRIRGAIKSDPPILPLAINAPGQVLRKGLLTVDLKTRRFTIAEKAFPPLAPQRFSLLCALIRAEGPVSREKLLLDIWGDSRDPKVVDVTIARLRRDIKNPGHVAIQTTHHGYALAADSPDFS